MQKPGGTPWISNGTTITLVVVSILAMLAFLGLSAYAPDLRTESGGRPNVLSKSAIGFAGLRVLLEETGASVAVSRNRTVDGSGLYILTPDADAASQSVADLATDGMPTLIILPKWLPAPDYTHAGWVRKWQTYEPEGIASLLKGLDDSTTILRPGETPPKPAKGGKQPPADATGDQDKPVQAAVRGAGAFGASPYPARITIDGFQTVAGKKWQPLLTDGNGHIVLAQLKGKAIYVLSDPDLINTAALKDENMANGALALIHRLPGGRKGVLFDVTLAGFDQPRSLLRTIAAPPFLAATLAALLAVLFMAFHALNRFGTPHDEGRSFAFGKRSLADNTVSLIRVMGRGPGMAPRYAAAIRRLAAKALRGGRAEDAAWLDAVERAGRITPTYAELLAEAETVKTETALMVLALKLHDWKSRITHERF